MCLLQEVWGGGLRFLAPSEPQGVEKKLFYKEINVGKTKQAIHYSDSLKVSVTRLMNSFIINLINIYLVQSCYYALCYTDEIKYAAYPLKSYYVCWDTIKRAHEIVQIMSPLVARKQTSLKIIQVKMNVYCKDTEFS